MSHPGMDTWARRIARGGWAEDLALQRAAVPIGPRNTYSNVAYLLAGVWAMLTLPGEARWALGGALIALGLGSAAYHAFKTVATNRLDWAGMGAVMTVLDLHAVFPQAPGLLLGALFIGMVAAVMIGQQFMHFDLLMGALALVAMVPPAVHGHAGAILPSFALFALAMVFWQADRKRLALVGLYGHATWHVLTAIAMPSLYRAGVLS